MQNGPTTIEPCDCANCVKLRRIQQRTLACCNPPLSHADDGVIAVWNDAVRDFPCIAS